MKRQAKRLCETALLAAVGLGIFVLEAQLPPLTAVPGIKPGLANCVTLAALYLLGCREAAGVLAVRILLGAVYTGSPVSLLYSAAGGLACYLVMAPLSRVFPARQLWIVSVFGALAHNSGQLAAAAVLLGGGAVLAYAPALILGALAAGTLTGLASQAAVRRIRKE
ncbi:MAG: Gx transporter family protein [Eubacteriales bacterium]|nr:Gx transporter family protein [Clostridiales bacterium]MDY3285980.1 Gx transporter family protein [Eubacteriales bacterium]